MESSTGTTNHHWMKIKAKVSRENLSKTLAADNRKKHIQPTEDANSLSRNLVILVFIGEFSCLFNLMMTSFPTYHLGKEGHVSFPVRIAL